MSKERRKKLARAMEAPMSFDEYEAIEINGHRITGSVFIEWHGYSFSCAYGRKQMLLETIGQ
jgi:hypothetical protein